MFNQANSYNPVSWAFNKLFGKSKLFTNLAQYFSSLVLKNPRDNIKSLFFAVGLSYVTYKVAMSIYNAYSFFNWVPHHLSRANNFKLEHLKQRYGNCYVLITGAADGIGFAYARLFAAAGFNLVTVDIQARKLMFRRSQLLQQFPGIKIQSFIVDMSDPNQLATLTRNLQKFDIGIVVNNVGLTGGGVYTQVNPALMLKTLQVNFKPMVHINKQMIPRLRKRKNRSAIINMTSCTSIYFSHRIGTYASMKCAGDIYSRTIQVQNRDKIDIITARPFGVSTGMLQMKKSSEIITPRQCAYGILSDLGYCNTTFSSFKHKIMGAYFGSKTQQERFKLYDQTYMKKPK